MIDFISLVHIAAAFFIVAVSPGPATLSNATIAMSKGRATSLVYGTGLSMGLLFWGVVAASGLGVVLQSSIYVLMLLKIIGALYLFWLAYLSLKSSFDKAPMKTKEHFSEWNYRGWFIRGFILNMSNPKTVVAWMAALTVGMSERSDLGFLVSAVITCMLVGFAVNAMYSIVFSLTGVMQAYQRVGRWVDRFVAGMFALAGVALLRSALSPDAT